MKYNKNPNNSGKPPANGNPYANGTPAKRKQEPAHLALPQFVQTPPSQRLPPQKRTADTGTSQRERAMQGNARRHKKRHKKNYILYYILLLFIIAVVGISLSLTVFFNVTTIAVEGIGEQSNSKLLPQEIITASGLTPGVNMFRINTDKSAKKIIEQYVIIDQVSIKRRLPDTLVIEVTLAETKVNLKYDGNYYSLSHGEKIINVGEDPLEPSAVAFTGVDLKDIKVGDYLTTDDKNKLAVIDEVLAAIISSEISGVTVVDITDEMMIRLYCNGLYEIKAGGVSELDYKLHCAKDIINTKLTDGEEKGVIDVSVDNGIYYFRPTEKIEIP